MARVQDTAHQSSTEPQREPSCSPADSSRENHPAKDTSTSTDSEDGSISLVNVKAIVTSQCGSEALAEEALDATKAPHIDAHQYATPNR